MKRLLILLFMYYSYGNADVPVLEKKVVELLDAHSDELRVMLQSCEKYPIHCPTELGVRSFAWLPGYIVKYNSGRIEGAKMMQDCIEVGKLDRLLVPLKYLYHVKGSSVTENCLVIVPKVRRAPPRKLSLIEVKQLCTLIYELGYWDIYSENLFITKSGKIVLLDTELRSFDYDKILDGLVRFVSHRGKIVYNYGLEKDALAYIFDQIKFYLRKSSQKRDEICALIKNDFRFIKNSATRKVYERMFYDTFG